MAHFAKLDENNVVIFVTVGREEDDGKELELTYRTGEVYKQTSYNTYGGVHYDPKTRQPSANQSKAFRKNFAGIGYTYDPIRDAFIAPKPHNSWILDDFTCTWNAPVAKPNDGKRYDWDENTTSWIEISDAS